MDCKFGFAVKGKGKVLFSFQKLMFLYLCVMGHFVLCFSHRTRNLYDGEVKIFLLLEKSW